MPENAQGDEHNQRGDETIFGKILPLIPLSEKPVDST